MCVLPSVGDVWRCNCIVDYKSKVVDSQEKKRDALTYKVDAGNFGEICVLKRGTNTWIFS